MIKKYSKYNTRPKVVKQDGMWSVLTLDKEGNQISSVGLWPDLPMAYTFAVNTMITTGKVKFKG